MRTGFKIDQGRVLLDRIDLRTDGARTVLQGDVNMSHWPEQMYRMTSTFDLARMREIFFARDRFTLSGTGRFDGTFHLFRDFHANGESRTGRELKGVFTSGEAGVNAHRFGGFRADVKWTPDLLDVTEAAESLGARGFRRQAFRDQVAGARLQMEAELVVGVGARVRPPEAEVPVPRGAVHAGTATAVVRMWSGTASP